MNIYIYTQQFLIIKMKKKNRKVKQMTLDIKMTQVRSQHIVFYIWF